MAERPRKHYLRPDATDEEIEEFVRKVKSSPAFPAGYTGRIRAKTFPPEDPKAKRQPDPDA